MPNSSYAVLSCPQQNLKCKSKLAEFTKLCNESVEFVDIGTAARDF